MMIGTPAPHKRVRFRGAARRAPMLVLAACCVTLYLSASFLLKGLRTGGAAGDGWAYYDDEDDKAGTGGRHRSLGKAEGVDGELDAAFERASHDRRFVSDQHEERAQQAQHAAGGVAGGAAAGLAVQQQGHPVAQEQQQGVHLTQQQAQQVQQGQPQRQQQGQQREPVLVLYSYEERGVLQKASFELFIITAMGIDSRMPQPADTEFAVGVLGQACEPCVALLPDVEPVDAPPAALPHYDQVKASGFLTLVFRFDASGGSHAGHNATLEWAARSGRLPRYGTLVFVTSEARGPFVPSYMPQGWQWTDAFARHLGSPHAGAVHGVGAALMCAPPGAPGGGGPRLEQWAFALDKQGLRAALDAAVFSLQPCAMCEDGHEAAPDGSVSRALLAAGHNLATLLAMYGPDVDWRDATHLSCNDNLPASMHGSYGGIDMHPLESLFVRSAVHSGEPHTARYSRWFMQRALGRQATHGRLDDTKYSFFMSAQARQAPDMTPCYPWLKHTHISGGVATHPLQ